MGDVIIVEDDLLLAKLFEKRLISLGYNVIQEWVTTGEAAVRSIVKYKPDLVLMDIKIQGKVDGIEAVKRARQQVDFPVIFMSGNSEPIMKERASDTEYLAYLNKPFSMEDLEEALQKLYCNS
ncbi:MAG: response regulator [Balneolales bacterium]